ncbi:Exopolysaccharide biosynthesis protein [Hathewaya proteolytica DSM 3090]|uniref:Exopolysaccharide biosynthesis protein n=1 Tax=Hathewaya proteolytica DSM 3090 TaxID=1121331 RepID=A0A1M6Q6J4_9CLOT|nr:phosphodiester glycosidase family protein [Hathewaya proteolytica]SHK15736.1 Exopolysaccharide biosynthesis protein [Hathewaya proteolytica DSM 3090]
MRKNKKYKIGKVTKIFIFILAQIVILFATGPTLIYCGPFSHLKSIVAQSAYTSSRMVWLTEQYMSKESIDKMMGISDNSQNDYINNSKGNVVKIPEKPGKDCDIFEVKGRKFKGLLISVEDPKRVAIGYCDKTKKEGQSTSEIAKELDAFAAINGGGFFTRAEGLEEAWSGLGGIPSGVIISKGELIFSDSSDYNRKNNVAAFTDKGELLVGLYSYNELKAKNVQEAICFGPALVINGKKTMLGEYGGWGIAPRTAIGQRKDGSVVMIVIEGRKINSVGATLEDVQDIMLKLGVVNATNLDGGYSTTMYYAGQVVNKPYNILGERAVPTIFYVKKDEK